MKKNSGFVRIIKATGYSTQGLRQAWRYEAAFRQEIILLLLAILLSFMLDVTTLERVLLIGTVVLVVIVELINSAIEAVVDRIGSEWHELSGRAKDLGSAAVFLALLLALFVWCSLLWPW